MYGCKPVTFDPTVTPSLEVVDCLLLNERNIATEVSYGQSSLQHLLLLKENLREVQYGYKLRLVQW